MGAVARLAANVDLARPGYVADKASPAGVDRAKDERRVVALEFHVHLDLGLHTSPVPRVVDIAGLDCKRSACGDPDGASGGHGGAIEHDGVEVRDAIRAGLAQLGEHVGALQSHRRVAVGELYVARSRQIHDGACRAAPDVERAAVRRVEKKTLEVYDGIANAVPVDGNAGRRRSIRRLQAEKHLLEPSADCKGTRIVLCDKPGGNPKVVSRRRSGSKVDPGLAGHVDVGVYAVAVSAGDRRDKRCAALQRDLVADLVVRRRVKIQGLSGCDDYRLCHGHSACGQRRKEGRQLPCHFHVFCLALQALEGYRFRPEKSSSANLLKRLMRSISFGSYGRSDGR